MTQILRTIPAAHYDALLGANAPSAGNVFATMADLSAIPSVNIYNSDGSLTANRTVSGAFDLDFANSGNFFRTGNITFTQGANRRLDLQQSTGLAGYNLTIEAGQGPVAGVGAGGSLILRPGNHGGGIGGGVGDIQLIGYDGALSARGSDFKFVTGSAVNNRGGNYDVTTGNGSAVHVGGNFTITTGTGVKRGDIRFKNGTEGTVGHVWTQNIADGSGIWAALPAAPITLYSGDGSTSGNRTVTLGGELIFNHGAAGVNGYVRLVSGGYFLNQTSIANNYFEYDNNSGTFLTSSVTHTRTGFKTNRSGTFIEMMSGGGKGYFNTNGYIEFYTNDTGTYAGMIDSTGKWRLGGATGGSAKVTINGAGNTSATINTLWNNLSGTELARLNDAGQLLVGTTTNNGSQLTSGGDVEVIGIVKGFVLQDRTLGTRHRLYLDNGSLFLEAA